VGKFRRALTAVVTPVRPPLFDHAVSVIDAIGELSHIDHGLLRRLGWNGVGGKGGLATIAALTLDPTSVTDAGQFLGFALLPLMATAPVESFYPRAGKATGVWRLPDRTIVEIIGRAWE
jgi:hypothetical protein